MSVLTEIIVQIVEMLVICHTRKKAHLVETHTQTKGKNKYVELWTRA